MHARQKSKAHFIKDFTSSGIIQIHQSRDIVSQLLGKTSAHGSSHHSAQSATLMRATHLESAQKSALQSGKCKLYLYYLITIHCLDNLPQAPGAQLPRLLVVETDTGVVLDEHLDKLQRTNMLCRPEIVDQLGVLEPHTVQIVPSGASDLQHLCL